MELVFMHQDKEQFLEILHNCLGIVTTAAKKANISTVTHYNWMKKDTEYAEAVKMVKETQRDFIESAFYKNVKDRKEASVLFGMKTLNHVRGYEDKKKIELEGKLEHSIELPQFIIEKNVDDFIDNDTAGSETTDP